MVYTSVKRCTKEKKKKAYFPFLGRNQILERKAHPHIRMAEIIKSLNQTFVLTYTHLKFKYFLSQDSVQLPENSTFSEQKVHTYFSCQ